MKDKELIEVNKEFLLTSKLKRIWRGIIYHGLLLYTSRNILASIGIDVHPYWIEKEGLDICKKSIEIHNPDQYKIIPLTLPELKKLASNIKWLATSVYKMENFNYRVLGLWEGNQLAAFTMAQFDSFEFKGKKNGLESHEAYLENMYTFENYRGRKLAPYLRYRCYEFLSKEGKKEFYSITQYFNKSSLKFKSKLGAQHLELWLHLGLFKKYRRSFLIKKYNPN